MLTRIMKWVTMVALLTAAALWSSAVNSQLPQFLLGCVVCLGAMIVILQARQVKKYIWAGGFAMIVLLFNPLVPIFPFHEAWGRWLALLAIVPFAVSLAALKTQPLMSMVSITGRNPGSESL